MSGSEYSCSIIVPCYNEVNAIAKTIENLFSAIPVQDSFEIIVVNDGSTDGTRGILERLEKEFPSLRVVDHNRNRGYGAALKTGIRIARSELIAITDADGTYPNERLPELVEACANYDMVVGARIEKGVTYSNFRAIPKFFMRKWMSWIVGHDIPDINSGMRVFKKSLAESYLGILPDSFSFTVTITLAMLTNYRPTMFLPISYAQRIGKSKIRPIQDTLRFMILILRTGVYFAPMRFFTPVFAALLFAALVSLAYDVWWLSNLTDKTVLLFLFTMNTGMFALLADMIDKRSKR